MKGQCLKTWVLSRVGPVSRCAADLLISELRSACAIACLPTETNGVKSLSGETKERQSGAISFILEVLNRAGLTNARSMAGFDRTRGATPALTGAIAAMRL